ncbi:MAG: O-antigen ligase family protein, partial [bacterium]|nr:O-antigen ligase family protein [bacterium]
VSLLVIVARQVTTAERRRTFFTVFLGTAALILALGALQWFLFSDSMVLRFDAVRQIWIPRLSSVLAHPNHFGGYLVFVLSLAAALTATRGLSQTLRLGAGLLTIAGLVATYFTYSRSAWIAVPTALVGALILPRTLKARQLLGLSALLLLLAGTVALGIPRVRQSIRAAADPAYESNRTRLDIAVGSLAQVTNLGAIVGEGLGDTVTLLGRTADISVFDLISAESKEAQAAKARTFVDNGVVKTWVEQGVVGLVLAGWVAVHLLRLGLRAFRRRTDPETRVIGSAVVGMICGLAALWLFLDVPDMFPANLYFWAFAGLLVASGASKASEA